MSFYGKIIKGIKIDKEKGFTLIELMIVVAILGILAAIAIPNFMRFQAKSKQSEAKTNLGAIGTTVEAYRTENDTYIIADQNADGDIWDDMGWAPTGNTRYAYGYDGMQLAGNPVTAATGTCGIDAATPAVAAGTATFLAVADGDVGDADATCDQWTYSETRTLLNTVNDVGQ